MAAGGKSERAVAQEIGISHAGLRKLLSGETDTPYQSTQRKITQWIQRGGGVEGGGVIATDGETPPEDPVERLLEMLQRDHPLLAAFMTLTSAELDEDDRRKMAFAQLNALKRAYIRLGDPIPPVLFDLERRFVGREEGE